MLAGRHAGRLACWQAGSEKLFVCGLISNIYVRINFFIINSLRTNSVRINSFRINIVRINSFRTILSGSILSG